MENIRITSGKYRGQTIKSPSSDLTHPMGSREKIALFNMIADFLLGMEVLDAYAGTGALGIEALSRGAKNATFIEKNAKIYRNLTENLQKLGLADNKPILGDAKKYTFDQEFGLIIADPPYDNFEIEGPTHLTNYLKNGGIFVLSHPGSAPVIAGLNLLKTRKYAKANISIYQKWA